MTKETVITMTKKQLEKILSEQFGVGEGALYIMRIPTDPHEQAEPEERFRFVARYEIGKGET